MLGGIGFLVAVGAFFIATSLTTCWQVTRLPGIAPASCGMADSSAVGTPVVGGNARPSAPLPTPHSEAPAVTYPAWDGASRVNIAFFGLRGPDPTEQCPLCTDTIIVFTIDPVARTAGMISIPRDLYVTIPGTDGCSGAHDGKCRINTAWPQGEAIKLPGGGPALAMKTVSQFLGVPIDHYAQVDFDSFVNFIDIIGGVDIESTQRLVLDPLGTGKDKFVITCCGMRHLNGERALAYARYRKTAGGDVDRSARQQQIIMAVRDKLTDPANFTTYMAKAPEMYKALQAGIHTSLTLSDALKFAALMTTIQPANITRAVIDEQMVRYANLILGKQAAAVLVPVPEAIRQLRDQVFSGGQPIGPIAQGDAAALMKADGARVQVTNASYTADLDQRTGRYLQAQGLAVVQVGERMQGREKTVVVIHTPKLYTLRYLISPLGLVASSAQIVFQPDPAASVDIEIRVGTDWATKIPAGF